MAYARSGIRVPWALLLLAGCGVAATDAASGLGPPQPPSQPAPTGERWQGKEVTDACGRSSLAWVLVDEICGGTEDPGYLESLRVPMFRDGALIGSTLYASDATHLWVLDAAQPDSMERKTLVSGFGEPIAMQTHGSNLVLAAGDAGLVIADVSDADTPRRAMSLALPGPAMDVQVSEDRACVAMGAAGLGVVDLSQDQPKLQFTVPIPGFAAAAACRGSLAYVAACNALVVVDLDTRAVVGQTWLSGAIQDDILVAPAKDVELVGDFAFVAAGRYGAVEVDVHSPAAPFVLGNCTLHNDPSFYASGLRAANNTLYVAAGEWGVLPVDVTYPELACTSTVVPVLPQAQTGSGEDCTTKPPWELQPWEDLWAPPPRSRDPIQVLPFGDVLFAFGDARRLGSRAVDVRDGLDPALALKGRYDEPRNVVGVAAQQGRVVVLGPGGGVFQRGVEPLLEPDGPLPADIQAEGRFAAFLADGRIAAVAVDQAQQSRLWVEGVETMTLPGIPPVQSLAVDGESVVIPGWSGPLRIDFSTETPVITQLPADAQAHVPAVAAALDGTTWFAAPEWVQTERFAGGGVTEIEPHGVFGPETIQDVGRWMTSPPRRILIPTQQGLVELASLGHDASVVWHAGELSSVALPPGSYVAGASAEGLVYILSVDRGLWRSQLWTLSMGDQLLELSSVVSFAGIGMGLAVDGERLYVADADKGIHVYTTGATPQAQGIVSMEVKP